MSRAIRLLTIAAFGAALVLPTIPTRVRAATVTFTPNADSYVEAAKPTRNNGTRAQLRVDASPVLNSYLRFDVQGVTDFSTVSLRLFLNTTAPAGAIHVRPVADTSWGETSITYSNAPAAGAVFATMPGGPAGSWVSVSLASLVNQNGLLSLALTSTSGTAVSIGSRESTTDPELIIGPAEPPPPPPGTAYVVSRSGSTYSAVSSTHTFTGTLKFVVESAVNILDGSGGGSVTFTAGDFDLGPDNFEFYDLDHITFQGQGMGVTTLRNSTDIAKDTEPFDITGADFVIIRDMTVNAGGVPRTTSDALDFDKGNNSLVERVQVTGSRARGIVFDGKGAGWTADNNIIRDCVISNVPTDGIELLASRNNLVEGCTITNAGGHGIQLAKASTSAATPNKTSNDNVIRNNTIDNSGQDGININAGDRNQLTGNMITNSSNITASRDGIRIGTSDNIACDDNSVNGNTATDNQATKTQSYGLNISSSLCNRTVVGVTSLNNFAGNRVGPIRDIGSGTIYPSSSDTEKPSIPTGLTATAISGCRIDLAWNASTDNVGVTGYGIYRDGVFLHAVSGTTLTFQDTGVAPGTTHTYRVDAADAALNRSDQSAPASATTPAAACAATFMPLADSWVDSSLPTANFGTSLQIRVDGSPTLVSYLKFNVQGAGSIGSAKLRFYANSAHTIGVSVRPVADTSWGEATITYANAPPPGAIAGSSGPIAAGTWVEIDITSIVTGNGTLSLALTTTSATAIGIASRESGVNAAQLVIQSS